MGRAFFLTAFSSERSDVWMRMTHISDRAFFDRTFAEPRNYVNVSPLRTFARSVVTKLMYPFTFFFHFIFSFHSTSTRFLILKVKRTAWILSRSYDLSHDRCSLSIFIVQDKYGTVSMLFVSLNIFVEDSFLSTCLTLHGLHSSDSINSDGSSLLDVTSEKDVTFSRQTAREHTFSIKRNNSGNNASSQHALLRVTANLIVLVARTRVFQRLHLSSV